jgi:hypothetical protein
MTETDRLFRERIEETETRWSEDELIDRAFGVHDEWDAPAAGSSTQETLRDKLLVIPGGRSGNAG